MNAQTLVPSHKRHLVTNWTWQPDPVQQRLCHAALGTGNGSVASFESAMKLCPIGHLEDGSSRLLPLVFRQLAAANWNGPELATLRGTHRHSWSTNQRLFAAARQIAAIFDAHNVNAVFLKGLPAAVLHYPDLGSRPFRDIDVLIPLNQVQRATNLLHELGFVSPVGREFLPARVASRHATDFEREADGAHCDLHWRVSYDEYTSGAEERLARSIPFKASGYPADLLRLDPTDSLLLTVVHGIRANVVAPVRWVVDSSLLLRHEHASIIWDRLIDDADRFRVLSSLRVGLRYLDSSGFTEHIPDQVLSELFKRRPHPADAISHANRAARPSFVQRAFRVFVVDYAQRMAGISPVQMVLQYPVYVVRKFRSATRLRLARRTHQRAVRTVRDRL
jgi:Uncharacterised nucleotidyltransferase